MTLNRVTQNMMSRAALDGLQTGLGRLSRIQEQLSTGKIINRPSDDPSGTTSAMRLRTARSDQQQYARNADDGLGWLNQIDTTLSSATIEVRRARELGLQGANTGSMNATSREALAVEVDKIREGLVGDANATYLGRPVFGGITAGDQAYDTTGKFVGQAAPVAGGVSRTVADGVTIRVDSEGPSVFGADGDSVFDHLTALSAALRGGDATAIRDAVGAVTGDGDRITMAQADVGTRTARIEKAKSAAEDADLSLASRLSDVENTDLPKATVELQLQQVAYQAALAATAKVMQPTLLDFLR
jgi:flagellar hook-associated protein 3 FlgL